MLAELGRAVAENGYTFGIGDAYRINTGMQAVPMVWADPPRLAAKTGRAEGTKEYEVILRLIDAPAGRGEQDTEDTLDKLEADLDGIAALLVEHDDIVKIGPLEYDTEEDTLTNRGDVSVKAVMKILTRY